MEYSLYTQEGYDIISKQNFLDNGDLMFLKENIKSLQDTYEKKQIWRTETEMRFSVLGSKPTPDAKYRQCIKEQDVFFSNLIQLSFDYDRNNVEIKKLKRKIENETDELEIESLNIDLNEAVFRKKNMELASKDRMREIKLWENLKKELLPQCKYSTENVNEHQKESYTHLLRNKVSTLSDYTAPADKFNILSQAIELDNINTNNIDTTKYTKLLLKNEVNKLE